MIHPIDGLLSVIPFLARYFCILTFNCCREYVPFLIPNESHAKKVGRMVNFGSAAMLNSTWKKVKAEADKVGIPLDEREFHCKGEFKGIHKGRPNEEDLKAAEAFVKTIL